MELKPPIRFEADWKNTVFIGGSINMGSSPDWQKGVAQRLLDKFDKLWVFNPRRDDWDPEAKQSIKNNYFRKQVEWEIHHLDNCSVAYFHIHKDGLSPISLYELGYMTHKDTKVIVCAHPEFARFGNLDIYKSLGHFQMYTDFETSIEELEKELEKYISS
jgi:hypothetical protein